MEVGAVFGPPSKDSAHPPPDVSQRPAASPVAAPLSPPIASMEVDEDVASAEVVAEEKDIAATTPKRRRKRQPKKKKATPSDSLERPGADRVLAGRRRKKTTGEDADAG